MEAWLLDWLNVLLRWLHLITGVAWVGASFYFVWLDNHLLPAKVTADRDRGVGGELWAVHGGGFYHAQKFRVAPPELPDTLHWFKWEAYWTWMSGMALLALVYWYGAELYLIDRDVLALGKAAAIAIGVASVVVGWLVYDALCRSPLGKDEGKLTWAVGALVVVAAIVLCKLFSGRGAFIHYGAMLGTIMVANVFFVIIPGQKELVTAKREGRTPDPTWGQRGKQRSVHNTYFTLPVLLVMVSNHYAGIYGHSWNWLLLLGLTLAGALIRVWFVKRHSGQPSPALLAVTAVLLAGIAAATLPAHNWRGAASASGTHAVSLAEVQGVIALRCTSCHAKEPTQPGFVAPPKGVVLESPDDIVAQAVQVHQQTVVTRAMPIGNLTGITNDERALIDAWFRTRAISE